MASDHGIRSRLLALFYAERDREWRNPLTWTKPTDIPAESIIRACQQLDQLRLIEWQGHGHLMGMGRITAHGCNVMEGVEQAPDEITVDNRATVAGSSHVQIGNDNIQGLNITIGELATAINGSSASIHDKEEARSLLDALLANPLVKIVMGRFGLGW